MTPSVDGQTLICWSDFSLPPVSTTYPEPQDEEESEEE